MAFYVKHPPNGDSYFRRPGPEWDPCTYGIETEHANTVRELKICQHEWNATGNRLYVLEAFRLACAGGLFPPMWVLKELDECFRRAVSKSWTLDRAFGFSGEGLGKGRRTSSQEIARLRNRNKLLCMAVWKLEGAGLTLPQACKAIAGLLTRLSPGGRILIGGHSLYVLRGEDISKRGIEKAVNESAPLWPGEKRATEEGAKTWSVEDIRKLLSVFFPAELPRGFLKRLEESKNR
jgi:hypothetical protein